MGKWYFQDLILDQIKKNQHLMIVDDEVYDDGHYQHCALK